MLNCSHTIQRRISTDCCRFCFSFAVASAYQLLLLTTAGLVFIVFEVATNQWRLLFVPLLVREDLTQLLAAPVQ